VTPTRSELRALANALRSTRTRLLPLELAERLQHAIVRLEDLIVSPRIDPAAIDDAYATAHELLRNCADRAPKR
jgi:hypothetical protein